MNLKNYTSTVPVNRSISNIEELLVEAGASHIAKWYSNGDVVGIIFQMLINNKPITFKLPSNPDAVEKVLKQSVKRPHKDTLKRIREQSHRTAWKLLYDWVAVQVSMILMEQAEAVQVFLPYIYDQKNDNTLFDKLKANIYKLLNQ